MFLKSYRSGLLATIPVLGIGVTMPQRSDAVDAEEVLIGACCLAHAVVAFCSIKGTGLKGALYTAGTALFLLLPSIFTFILKNKHYK